MPTPSERVQELFHVARGLADTAARRAYLERTTVGEPELRARVEELLAAEREADSAFLKAPTKAAEALGERAGDTIGRYRLLQEIGQGGMGTVWMAEQREPVVRKVALKIIKLGLDTREVVVRFEAERQALALMDHPHIAKVLDGGATASGRPYFVMELVKGVPITEYCDNAKLGLRERLELFTKVCEAIQHAHHKGVIHRDIKPSNVLVTLHDGVPVPKVIDFGIAKATSAELTKKTLFTQYAQILGTPEYMAPEQAEMSGLDIDTRADVYSLGVLLYELLTGSKPFDLRTAMQAGFQELLRTIREDEPVRPSTRVSTVRREAPPPGVRRELNVESWSARLRGDLDWIVMRALEKDRSRRYDTPNGFAEDISRYLRDEPVLAAPPSAAYRFTKFVRRRRKTVIAASVVVALLVFGIAGTSYGLLEARDAAEAERLAKKLSEERRAEAERNLEFARRGNEILSKVFSRLDPNRDYESLGELRSALRSGLEDAVAALGEASVGDPLEVARLQKRLGTSLTALGEHRAAAELFETALGTVERELGADHEDALALSQNLAAALLSAGELERALGLLERHLEHVREKFGAEHAETLDAMFSLGEALASLGRTKEAASQYEAALPLLEKQRGPDDRATILCLANLGTAKSELGRTKDAAELLATAFERAQASLGADHPDTLGIGDNLASTYQKRGDMKRALPMLEATHRRLLERLGADHSKTMAATNNLASAYEATGKLEQALPLLESLLASLRSANGESHPKTLLTGSNLGALYFRMGKNDLAVPLLETTVRLQRETLPADHPELLAGLGNLAAAYWKADRLGESIPLFEEVVRLEEAKHGREHESTRLAIGNLGTNYKTAGRYAEALPLLIETRENSRSMLGLRPMTIDLLEVRLRLGQRAEAEPLFDEVASIVRSMAPEGTTKRASALAKLAQIWVELGAASEAESILVECLAIREKEQPDSWSTFNARSLLGAVHLARDDFAKAEPLLTDGAAGLLDRELTLPTSSRVRLTEALERAVELYTRWNAAAPSPELATKLATWDARLKARASN